MTQFAELNGNRVTDGRITLPFAGAWHADVTLDKEVSIPATGLTLILAGLTLSCAAWRAPMPYQGRTRLRLIGGAGKWRNVIGPQGYKASAGVKLSLVLGDAARSVGERITVGTDRVVGATHYVRESAPACRLLNRLVPGEWWIDPDGTTKTGTRPTSTIASAFTIVSFDGARGAAVVATEKPEDFVPGRTFRGITLASTITIGGVTHMITKTGLRTEVLAA